MPLDIYSRGAALPAQCLKPEAPHSCGQGELCATHPLCVKLLSGLSFLTHEPSGWFFLYKSVYYTGRRPDLSQSEGALRSWEHVGIKTQLSTAGDGMEHVGI